MKTVPDLRPAYSRTLDAIARQRKRPARPAVVLSAVQTAEGLLKPRYGQPPAVAPRAPVDGYAPRKRSGVPISARRASLAGLDAADAPTLCAADMDDDGLRRLGSEIIAEAVNDLRRAEPERRAVDADEHRRRATARRLSAEGFLRGEGLERCVQVFGVRVDPTAVRRVLPPTVADRQTRALERHRLRFC